MMKTIFQCIALLILFGALSLFAYDLETVDAHALQLRKRIDGVFLVWTNARTEFYISPVKVDFLGLAGKTLDDRRRMDLHGQLIWQFVPTAKKSGEEIESWGYYEGSGQWAFLEGTNLVLTRFQISVSDPKYGGVTNHVFQVHCESFSTELEKGFAHDIALALEETKSGAAQNNTR